MTNPTYPKICEYRNLGDAPMSKETTLDTATVNGLEYRLVHRSEGYRCAGSCARWDNESYGVLFRCDNAEHGRLFKGLGEADMLFKQITGITDPYHGIEGLLP